MLPGPDPESSPLECAVSGLPLELSPFSRFCAVLFWQLSPESGPCSAPLDCMLVPALRLR